MRKPFVKSTIGMLVLIPLLLGGCLKNDAEDIPDFNEQLQRDLQAIDSYLADHNITASQDADGLIRYVIQRDSSGAQPTLDGCVTANYQGIFMSNGQEFDKADNASFPLASVIDGWKIAMPLLNVGDSASIYIPSGLAYGYYGIPPDIPQNANLIFHVGLVKVGSTYTSSDRSCN